VTIPCPLMGMHSWAALMGRHDEKHTESFTLVPTGVTQPPHELPNSQVPRPGLLGSSSETRSPQKSLASSTAAGGAGVTHASCPDRVSLGEGSQAPSTLAYEFHT
jgi:hypothetical protein